MMERDKHTPSPIIYILVCLFGINASLATNAIWVEYPTLITVAPEGRSLVLYLVVILEVSNLASIAYLLTQRCSGNRLSEVPFVYSTFALGAGSLILIGFFWDHNTEIVGQSHSFILLICAFFSALISCISSVTYVPFTSRLREPYITGGILGESLGKLIPHIVGIAQGIGRKPDCVYMNVTKNYHSRSYYPRTTTPLPITPQRLRFDESYYFYIFSGIVGICGLSFILLRCVSGCKFEYTDPPIENMEDVELNPAGEDGDDEVWQAGGCEGAMVLDDGTIRHRDPCNCSTSTPPATCTHKIGSQYGRNFANNTPNGPASLTPRPSASASISARSVRMSSVSGSLKSEIDPTKPRSFFLLMAIALWTSSILCGPLSSIRAYACFPVGNNAFLIGACIAALFTIITCPISLRIHDHSRITIVVALTSLGTILLTYFVALITFSHTTESKDSPIFGNAGELLATIAWIAITGLFSVAQVTIALLCRDASREAVTWYSIMIAIGSALGTLFIIDDISICKVFRSYENPYSCKGE